MKNRLQRYATLPALIHFADESLDALAGQNHRAAERYCPLFPDDRDDLSAWHAARALRLSDDCWTVACHFRKTGKLVGDVVRLEELSRDLPDRDRLDAALRHLRFPPVVEPATVVAADGTAIEAVRVLPGADRLEVHLWRVVLEGAAAAATIEARLYELHAQATADQDSEMVGRYEEIVRLCRQLARPTPPPGPLYIADRGVIDDLTAEAVIRPCPTAPGHYELASRGRAAAYLPVAEKWLRWAQVSACVMGYPLEADATAYKDAIAAQNNQPEVADVG